MSILQEYQYIRRMIGESEYRRIEEYLQQHPEMLLSDIYYNRENYNKYRLWADSKR